MEDRRRTPRAILNEDELWADVYIPDSDARALGRVVDASDLGFGMELDGELSVQPGDLVIVHFRDRGAARSLGIEGLVCGCDVRRITDGTTLGVEAPLLDPEIRERLADLVWERTEHSLHDAA